MTPKLTRKQYRALELLAYNSLGCPQKTFSDIFEPLRLMGLVSLYENRYLPNRACFDALLEERPPLEPNDDPRWRGYEFAPPPEPSEALIDLMRRETPWKPPA